jgi:hypothetical protein
MSEENQGNENPDQKEDVVQNLKAEFARKNENITNELAQLKQYVASLAKPAPQTQTQEEEVDPYDPQKYAAHLEKKVEKRLQAEKEATERARAQESRKQQVLYGLIQEYPDLQNPQSELVKEANQILAQLPPEEATSPVAYKAAILEAATNKGVAPRSKRSSSDDFVMGGSKGKSGKKAEDEFDPKVQAWMQIMSEHSNINFDDPKVKARIKERQERILGGKK